MKIDLIGKNALIGGSSKGIGKAIAERLALSGANIILMASNEQRLKKVQIELDQSRGQQHRYIVVDFSDYKTYSKKIELFFKENTVDILINNTQGPAAGGALEKEITDYQAAFDLLFKCVVHTTNLALPHMQKQKWGRIINIASVSVKEPLNYLVLSNSLRAAMVTWAKSLSLDIAADQITINNTLTGFFDTERIAQLNTQKAEKMGIDITEAVSYKHLTLPTNLRVIDL